jgi:3-hydroxybutyryl-CoA dehydrogenase
MNDVPRPAFSAPVEHSEHPLRAAVVGTGVMGRGIAQLMAQAGCRVSLYDAREGAAEAACGAVLDQWSRLLAKGKLSEDAVERYGARLAVVETLDELSGCDLVIEAIVEDLDVKRSLFRDLEARISPGAILATNTSSLSVTQLAAGCRHPSRVAGLHFFNPVPLMRVVEIIGGARTEPAVLDQLEALVRRTGHAAVRAKDTPGFIVNHAGRAYPTEALKIVGEGVAEFADVDDILREASGFKLGPFELLDLTALDVSHPVMESIYEQYYQEPRYRPSGIARQRLAAGLLGRKSGRGFYEYAADGARQAPTGSSALGSPSVPDAGASDEPRTPPVWVGGGERDDLERLRALVVASGAVLESADLPSPGALILTCPLGWDASTTAAKHALDAVRTVAVDPMHGFAGRRTLMTNPLTDPAWLAAARRLLTQDGTAATVIRDSTGFVSQRVLAMVVNLGCDIVQQRVCSPADLDTAVRLGLGYPQGPLAWGDVLGPQRVLRILDRLLATTGDPRYRPSPWLRRRSQLGASLLQPD